VWSTIGSEQLILIVSLDRPPRVCSTLKMAHTVDLCGLSRLPPAASSSLMLATRCYGLREMEAHCLVLGDELLRLKAKVNMSA
jgi:hypothetical protein